MVVAEKISTPLNNGGCELKAHEGIRTLRLVSSPLDLYMIYILVIFVAPRTYFVYWWSLLIYSSILLQGCILITMVVVSFGRGVFLNRPLSPTSLNSILAIIVSQLVCWPLFFLHSTYAMLLPYVISIGIPNAPIPSPVDLGIIGPFYLLYVLALPFLLVTIGFFLFLCFSYRPYREKCVAFNIFVSTFSVVLVINASKIAPVPDELLYMFWLLPSILMFAYLPDRRHM